MFEGWVGWMMETYGCCLNIIIEGGHALGALERDSPRGDHEVLILDRMALQLYNTQAQTS
jgi:hypothetical protein